MLPEGLHYVSSWISQDLRTCYQLMETDNYDFFALWLAIWNDLMTCEIVPVRTSAEMVERMQSAS